MPKNFKDVTYLPIHGLAILNCQEVLGIDQLWPLGVNSPGASTTNCWAVFPKHGVMQYAQSHWAVLDPSQNAVYWIFFAHAQGTTPQCQNSGHLLSAPQITLPGWKIYCGAVLHHMVLYYSNQPSFSKKKSQGGFEPLFHSFALYFNPMLSISWADFGIPKSLNIDIQNIPTCNQDAMNLVLGEFETKSP